MSLALLVVALMSATTTVSAAGPVGLPQVIFRSNGAWLPDTPAVMEVSVNPGEGVHHSLLLLVLEQPPCPGGAQDRVQIQSAGFGGWILDRGLIHPDGTLMGMPSRGISDKNYRVLAGYKSGPGAELRVRVAVQMACPGPRRFETSFRAWDEQGQDLAPAWPWMDTTILGWTGWRVQWWHVWGYPGPPSSSDDGMPPPSPPPPAPAPVPAPAPAPAPAPDPAPPPPPPPDPPPEEEEDIVPPPPG